MKPCCSLATRTQPVNSKREQFTGAMCLQRRSRRTSSKERSGHAKERNSALASVDER